MESSSWTEFSAGCRYNLRSATFFDHLMSYFVTKSHSFDIVIELIENMYVSSQHIADMIFYIRRMRKYDIFTQMYKSRIVRGRIDWPELLFNCLQDNSHNEMPEDGVKLFQTVLTDEPIAKVIRFNTIPDWLEKILKRTEMFSRLPAPKRIKVESLQEVSRDVILRALSGSTIKERDTSIHNLIDSTKWTSYLKFE